MSSKKKYVISGIASSLTYSYNKGDKDGARLREGRMDLGTGKKKKKRREKKKKKKKKKKRFFRLVEDRDKQQQ